MTHALRRTAIHGVPALLALAVAACGDAATDPPGDRVPEIVVTGVEDGQVLDGPTRIDVEVSPGSYQATLNDGPFFSGSTVAEPGAYVLEVRARNGVATAERTVAFQIRLAGESVLIVRLLDLGDNDAGGGGDAILLSDSSAAGQRHVLVDAGPQGPNGSNEGFVQARLAALGVDTLQAVILSHAHTDHYVGLRTVLEGTVVRDFVYNGQVRNLSSYTTLLAVARARAGRVLAPDTLLAWALGLGGDPTALTVVPPLATGLDDPDAGSSQINEGSLGTAVGKGAFTLFLTGDGEVEANARWRTTFPDLTGDLTVLKVGHHGANDAVFDNGASGSSAWLAHTAAELRLISSNGTTHPRVRALSALLGQGPTYCTSVHGDITIRVAPDGSRAVEVERNADLDCVPGSEAAT